MTHSLRVALVATALPVAEPSNALAQAPAAQTQEPSKPAKPSTPDEVGSHLSGRAPPETTPRPLSLFDNWLSNSSQPWLPSAEVRCFGCRGFETSGVGPETTNATAPWVLQGRWQRQTALGTVSAGFVGMRNYALPLYTAMPLGGDVEPGALRAAGTSAFAPLSQWSLTASLEKTLMRSANGASIGVVADALIPVATDSVKVGHPGIGALASPTYRFGIRFRW